MPSFVNFTVNNALKDNHTIKSGEQVIIKCAVSSYPASNYVIRKNGSLVLNDTAGQYIIQNMTFYDEGWYTCFARNGIGEGITTRLHLMYGGNKILELSFLLSFLHLLFFVFFNLLLSHTHH